MTPETTLSFLEQLRSETSNSHKQLESLPVSISITNPSITIAQYAHYLQLMHAVIAETESLVFDKINSILHNIDSRRKLAMIESDLTFIGYGGKKFPTVIQNVQNGSTAFAMGVMYTVEGSTLGGRFILKNIQTALGFDEHNGAKFFFGYGNRTGHYWKDFLFALDRVCESEQDKAEVIAGAQHAFDAIYGHFAANPV